MGNAYTYQMPSGIPGAVNRLGGRGADIEAQIMDSSSPVTAYGLAGMIDATTGTFRALTGTDTGIYGFLVRPYPLQAETGTNYGAVALGTPGTPPTSGAIDVLKSGYMTVLLQEGTAVKNGVVYVRIQNASGNQVIGGVEADSGADVIAIGAYFMGPADANGNVEIAFNI